MVDKDQQEMLLQKEASAKRMSAARVRTEEALQGLTVAQAIMVVSDVLHEVIVTVFEKNGGVSITAKEMCAEVFPRMEAIFSFCSQQQKGGKNLITTIN